MRNEQKNLSLPAPDDSGGSRALPERYTVYQAAPDSGDAQEPLVPLSHYLWMLRRHKWSLLAFIAVAVTATIAVSSRLTPIYQATTTLDVDRLVPTGVIGQEANSSRLGNNDTDQFLTTQVALIMSDSVLRPVAHQFKMGPAETGKPGSSARADAAPIGLGGLTVTRPPKTYLLKITYHSPDPQLAADVANAVADSYQKHTFEIRYQAAAQLTTFMDKQLEELKAKMEGSSGALSQFEKEFDVISPEAKANILSARLLQLNTEYTTSQADRIRKEAAANSVKDGSFEALEVSTQSEQLRIYSQKVADAAEKFAAIKNQYGPSHPAYKQSARQLAQIQADFEVAKSDVAKRVAEEFRGAKNREQMLQQEVAQTKEEFDRINARSFEYAALKRDADADKALYEELTKKIKEAGINASFQNSSIRVADPARPALRPYFPNTRTNALLALLASMILGIAAVFVSEGMDRTLKDPDQIQRSLQTEVLGSLPVVKAWRGHLPSTAPGAAHRPFFGSSKGAANAYEEAVRTLRDSILLPHAAARPRTLLMTSATPREGKTTTAVHLAVVHSQQKRKTLLIDADLRRPGVYHHVGLKNDVGLSNVVNGESAWRDLLQSPEGLPWLSVLPAGPPSRRAADGLGETLRSLLAEAVNEYDLVICDAPPLLGFAESLQIASLVDGVVVVALAGQTEKEAVASVFTNLKRLKANIIGLALNEVRADMSERYYYYGYYGKYYSRYYKPLSD
ncbi:MAG TPA: polysaccharide biosynthesis tyrosine autokinase [Bryobacteraceae bacterium]|jgi:capsular exopolysaccharide synthesis family protein|nr:polysaccharide biosynthesis tyrosine autokinase [Bryobacteraceae bacterium]